MPKSMTAYGSAEGPTAIGHLRLEMRTVNHRFLEISTKLPEELRSLEPLMRERIGQRLSRGNWICRRACEATPSDRPR